MAANRVEAGALIAQQLDVLISDYCRHRTTRSVNRLVGYLGEYGPEILALLRATGSEGDGASGRVPSEPGSRPSDQTASRSGPSGFDPSRRPWQPWERSYSGNRIGVRQEGDWTILSVLAGGAETTSSIREHEAWNLALQICPAIGDRLTEIGAETRRMRAALHELSPACAGGNADVLREAAKEIDCGDGCRNYFYDGSCNAHECSAEGTEEGCCRQKADSLRSLADSLEAQAAVSAARVSDEQPKAEDAERLSPKGASAVGEAETPALPLNPPQEQADG